MKKLNKLIITEILLDEVLCTVCAVFRDQKVVELRLEPSGKKNTLNNIYVGQVENIAANIQAAFVQIGPGKRCYYPLAEAQRAVFSAGRKGNGPLRPGDELLVQVSRDAMKGKLPALTSNLNFTGRYLVLTTGDKKFGLSSKLTQEDRHRLSGWLKEEADRPDKEFGIIVRTNAADASKEEILKLVTIRYSMGLNRYQKYVATTIASDVSESTTAAIMENLDTLQGVNIEEDSIRYYPDSKYFASILGYTGVISQDEYDALDEKEQDSQPPDVVFLAGEAFLRMSLPSKHYGIKMTDFVRFILILYSSIFEKHAPQSIRFAYDSLSISRLDTRIFTAVP